MTRVDANGEGRKRIVIIDDSPFYRLRFSKIFGRSERLNVVGTAANGEDGIHLIARERPDVVLLDLTMPGLDGFAVLRWAMSRHPVPIVVFSSRKDRESVFRALELGAVDYITKPESAREGLKGIEHIVTQRVEAAALANVGHYVRPAPAPVGVAREGPAARVVALAASTGGPAAIQRLARELPRGLTVPIVVAQHMPPGFTRMFAERLDRTCHYTAVEGTDGAVVRPGTLYVAQGGLQTTIEREGDEARLVVRARKAPDVHAPSADLLFESAARAFGEAAVVAVLTGMGDDGSRGVRSVKDAGGYVIAETSDSALIYGMPRAAVATGCVDAELPLARIPEALLALSRRNER